MRLKSAHDRRILVRKPHCRASGIDILIAVELDGLLELWVGRAVRVSDRGRAGFQSVKVGAVTNGSDATLWLRRHSEKGVLSFSSALPWTAKRQPRSLERLPHCLVVAAVT